LENSISIFFHYANKPLLEIYKVLFENLFYYENCILYCSELFCSILGKFIIWFESNWSQNAKLMKKQKKTEKEEKKRKKIETGSGQPSGPAPDRARGPGCSALTGTSLCPSRLANRRAHPVSISFFLQPAIPREITASINFALAKSL
jgi:hypothetical protein